MKKLLVLMVFGGFILGAGAGLAQDQDQDFADTLAQNQDFTDTLSRIKRDKQVFVGHRESSVPFSFYDNAQNVVGYSQDYSNLIVAAIKNELNEPDLAVKLVPVTSQNRIPLLQNGSYDFECGSTTNNLDRQKQVDFSNTIFIIGTRLLTNQNSGINDFDDLRGRTVVVTSGTTSEKLLFAMNNANNLNLDIISAKDHGDSFRLVESGRAAAFFIDDALLAGERAKAKNPKEWVIVGTPQSFEAYGCMLRKGDARFKKLVDDVIVQAQSSGVALKAYNKWFMNPIPPKNVSLDFEMSDVMKQLFASPNDRPFQ